MNRSIKLCAYAFTLATSVPLWAEPTLYPPDLNVLSGVTNSTSSNILADAADSQTVWVMPPNTAEATVSGLHTKTAWMGFCAEMRDQTKYSKQLSEDIAVLMQKRVERQEELSKLQSRADQINEEAETFAVNENLQALLDIDVRIQAESLNIAELNKTLDSCTHDCGEIKEQIKDANSALQQMRVDRNTIARQNAVAVMKYDQKKAQAKAAQRTADNARGVYTQAVKDLTEVQTTFRQSFAFFGAKEGARAGIAYTSDWDANVQRLRDENPGINFSKVATQNAKLMTVLTSLQGLNSESAIQRIEIGAQTENGAATFPAFPEGFSANVVLSLIGACPMEHPEYFDIKDNDVGNMKYGVVVTYDYQTLFKAKATVTYDYYKMYQKIVSSGSSGGFFSSRSWSNVEEKNFFRDSFTVTWNDPENTVPQADKDAREQEMRRSVLSRLATMALPESVNLAGIIAAAPPPRHGAVVAADQLVKVCPGNIYCMGTAAVLNVLDAIFGSSSSNSSYTKIQEGTITENYNNITKITKSWITSYL
jgi:hypothetical protein